MKRAVKFFCLPLVAVFLMFPENGVGCGPFFPDAIFTYKTHPPAPLKAYAEGSLGVLLPGFDYHYLFVAHRHLSGHPLSQAEVREISTFWKQRVQERYTGRDTEETAIQEWTTARKIAFTGEPPAIEAQRSFGQYSVYANCLPDAFHTAALTLKDRAQKYGATSSAMREWLRGQDTVFSDCNADQNMPSAAPSSSPRWLIADRQYQIASAYFYSEKFDEAVHEFDQIAGDTQSPWHVIAPYLAARALIRKATLKSQTMVPDEAPLKEAQVRLRKIQNDPARRAIHAPVRKLLAFISIRLNPKERTHELARLLAGAMPDANLRQDLIDYLRCLDQGFGDMPDFWQQKDITESKLAEQEQRWQDKRFQSIARFRQADEVTDWIFTYHGPGDTARRYAVARWQKERSLPWLVAAIAKIEPDDPAFEELTEAAEQVKSGSPAYPTVSYHRVRLMIAKGDRPAALALLNKLLPELQKQISDSSFNLFLGFRAQLATGFNDYLAYASRTMIDTDDDMDSGPWGGGCNEKDCGDLITGHNLKLGGPEARFDREAALVLNTRLPLDRLAPALLGSELPPRLRGELAVATWTRAVILGHHDKAITVLPYLEGEYPGLKEPLEHYKKAEGDQEKWRTALLIILRNPGMRPYLNAGVARPDPLGQTDSYRDNWWCEDVGAKPDTINYSKNFEQKSKQPPEKLKDAPPYPEFLSASEVESAKSEWKKLAAAGTGPNYLTQQVINWTKESPKDKRIPEALHLAVHSTHFGCTNDKTSRLSKQAFELLHSRYPHSPWAKKTPYWY